MDATRYAIVREIFFEADDLPPDRRDAFVRGRCGDDAELEREVLKLLRQHNRDAAIAEGDKIMSSTRSAMERVSDDGTSPRDDNVVSDAKESSPHGGNAAPEASGPSPISHDDEVSVAGPAGRVNSESGGVAAASSGGVAAASSGGVAAGVTVAGAMRTHAEPKHPESARENRPRRSGGDSVTTWYAGVRHRKFRVTGAMLYLLSLLPTVAIGSWTYVATRSKLQAQVRNELRSVTESVALSTDRFLTDQSTLVQSWARQEDIVAAAAELSAMSLSGADAEQLRRSPRIDAIETALVQLSGRGDVKFVLWDRSSRTIASWSAGRDDVGHPVAPEGAADVARVFAGRTIVWGPRRLPTDIPGFTPETDQPVMAVMVPIYSADAGDSNGSGDRVTGSPGRVIAAMLVRGVDLFDGWVELFDQTSDAAGMDVYAVDRRGMMLTPSRRAIELAAAGRLDLPPDRIATWLKVTDPGNRPVGSHTPLDRDGLPPTASINDLRRIRDQGVATAMRIDPYANYAGRSVVGASAWLPDWNVGVVAERPASEAFSAVDVVRNGYLGLATLLALSSIVAAARIARQSIAETAAVHPLSRYEVVDTLGTGGMGVVYHARHRDLGRDCAVKILRLDRQNREDFLRFDREAKLAASLANPHSVTIHDYGRSPSGDPYCVMQYLHGITLQEVVARDGPQSIGRVLLILRQICEALAEAHQAGLCHRDIKPHNIMLSPDPAAGDWAVVFDYGLAKPLQPDAGAFQTAETMWAGTPMYMAPERFRQPSRLDPTSDIYSVGAVAYYLLAGRPPFLETEPEQLFGLILSEEPIGIALHRRDGCPDEIEQLVRDVMHKDIEQRSPSMRSVAQRIDQLRTRYPWDNEAASSWWNMHGGDEV